MVLFIGAAIVSLWVSGAALLLLLAISPCKAGEERINDLGVRSKERDHVFANLPENVHYPFSKGVWGNLSSLVKASRSNVELWRLPVYR